MLSMFTRVTGLLVAFALVGRGVGNLLEHVLAFDELAEGGVLAIEETGIRRGR